MSITTRGWGSRSITTVGWGDWVAPLIRRAWKRFTLFVARSLGLTVSIEKEALPVEIDLSVATFLAVPVMIAPSLALGVSVSRSVSIAVLIDPEEA